MSSLYGDCITHILKFLPLNKVTPVILVNKTWNGELTQSVWHTHCLVHLEKEIVSATLNSHCVKLYRKLFGDHHQIIEDLLLSRKEKVIKKKIRVKKTSTKTIKSGNELKTPRRNRRNDVSPTVETVERKVSNRGEVKIEKKIEMVEKKDTKKVIDYHKSLKGYVMGKLVRREGDELKKLIRFPLQKVFGEGDGRKIDRKVAFERKWKKVNEFLNENVSFHKDDLKNKYTSNSINEMFLRRLKYDLNLVFKKDKSASFELGRKISLEMASGQLLQRFKIMRFVELFYEYFDSSIIMSDQLQLITNASEVPIEKFNSFTFESFKKLLDFISKYCPKQVESIRNHIENDTTKNASLKSFLFEKPQRFLGHYLLGKFGMKLFADISDGFDYCLAEYKFEIPDFLVECLIYRTDKIDETKKLDMVEAYSKQYNIPYLNLDFIIQIINRSNKECYYKKNETIRYIETLLSKIKDDPELPLIFRITACGKFVDSWESDEFLALLEVILNYSNKVFDAKVQPPYQDPLIFISSQLQSAFGTFSAVQGWVNLFLKFLQKGSRKKFADKNGRTFRNIVMSKPFPSSIRYILVDYLD